MTPQEKRERRQLRHQLQGEVRKNLTLEQRMCSTPKQLQQAARTISDKILNDKYHGIVEFR